MSAYSVTAANVKKSSLGKTVEGTAGETITQGMPVYLKSSDSKYYKSDADAAAPANDVDGIALNAASADQPLTICVSDPDFTTGFTMAVGDILVVGDTAGALHPSADLTSDWYPLVIGVATSTTKAIINCTANGLKGTAAIAGA